MERFTILVWFHLLVRPPMLILKVIAAHGLRYLSTPHVHQGKGIEMESDTRAECP